MTSMANTSTPLDKHTVERRHLAPPPPKDDNHNTDNTNRSASIVGTTTTTNTSSQVSLSKYQVTKYFRERRTTKSNAYTFSKAPHHHTH